MDKQDLYFYICISLTIAACCLLIYVSLSLGKQCVANPYKYLAEKASEDNLAHAQCQCRFDDPNVPTVFFNETSMWAKSNKAGSGPSTFDLPDFPMP